MALRGGDGRVSPDVVVLLLPGRGTGHTLYVAICIWRDCAGCS